MICEIKLLNSKENSMLKSNVKLYDEWDFIKNKGVNIYEISKGSVIKYYWLCKLGHSYVNSSNKKTSRYSGCPYCSNSKVLIGFNDINTTSNELSKLLFNYEDGFKYTKGSKVKLDWRCDKCKNIIRSKQINQINNYGLKCPKCSDGISFNEKFISNLLSHLKVKYHKEISFEWSKNKRYDFYIDDKNIIIECNGLQHYTDRDMFHVNNSRKLKDEIENDKIKKKLAIDNGINDYIVIEMDKNNMDLLIENIKSSKLSKIYNLEDVNWKDIETKSLTSILIEICDYYNKNNKVNIFEIANNFNINKLTAYRYLKKGSELGICSYNKKRSLNNSNHLKGQSVIRKVTVKNVNTGEIINFESLTECANHFKIQTSNITRLCKQENASIKGVTKGFEFNYID